jgi:hypothetical protein
VGRTPLISVADETRAITALRGVTSTPELATIWAALRPSQRMAFVIGTLLELPACCETHEQASRRILHGFFPTDVDAEHDAVRRRALEILTAVALVDDQPGAAPIVPLTHGTS